MTCRAPTNATTCSGTQTGQILNWDQEGRLSTWQNQPSSPTSVVNYLYDGEGQRVAQKAKVSGVTTVTASIGSLEEVQTGGSTQTTTYYAIGGIRIAATVNGTWSYFGYDLLGSQVLVLDNAGNVAGSQLYGPYGNQRYITGVLPTSIGFTGQRADSVTGLDYYVARYYDPVSGQFLSPDSVQGNAQGMSPYAYVGGSPETRTDPTGKMYGIPGGGDHGVPMGNGQGNNSGSNGSSNGGNNNRYYCNSVGCYDNGVLVFKRTTPSGQQHKGGEKQPTFIPVVRKAPTQQQVKHGQQEAQTDAIRASADLALLASTFSNLSAGCFALAAIIGLIMSPLSGITLGPVAVAGLVIAVAALVGAGLAFLHAAQMASQLSRDFSYESTQALAWFTEANLQNQLQAMQGEVNSMMNIAIPATLLGMTLAVGLANPLVLVSAVTFGGTEVAVNSILGQSVIDEINKQENDVLT